MAGASGDFTVPDDTGTTTDLNTLFGVAQGVGDTPVTLRGGSPLSTAGKRRLRQAGEDVSGIETYGPATTTLQGALASFYTLDRDNLSQIQALLYQGGYYGSSYYSRTNPKSPRLGIADDDTYAAYKSAVTQAARSGRPLMDILSESAQAGPAQQDLGPPPRAGLTGGANAYNIDLSNPVDITAAAQRVAGAVLGKKAGPDDIARIVSAIQGQERSGKEAQIAASEGQQRAQFNAQLAGRAATEAGQNGPDTYIAPVTTTTTAPVNAQTEAEAELRAAHPVEAQAHDATSVYATLLSLIKGGG